MDMAQLREQLDDASARMEQVLCVAGMIADADCLSDALRNSARELIADARRYRWLKERLHGVDFNYMDADNRANSVIVFKIDDEVRMSGNLDLSIDAAIAQEQK